MLKSDRRAFLLGMGSVTVAGLAGCSSTARETVDTRATEMMTARRAEGAVLYAAKADEQFPLPAIPYQKIDPKLYRQMVPDPTGEAPGTLVVNTKEKHLYLVLKDGKAMRYGVGLGRQGYSWKGRAVVQWKRKWPTWTPPSAMIKRKPELEKWRTGMPPGLHNPLGARALYIYKDGVDTLYRIHGSPEWRTIGKSASSGCVRMFNQDVIDLYDRVPSKTTLVVI